MHGPTTKKGESKRARRRTPPRKVLSISKQLFKIPYKTFLNTFESIRTQFSSRRNGIGKTSKMGERPVFPCLILTVFCEL